MEKPKEYLSRSSDDKFTQQSKFILEGTKHTPEAERILSSEKSAVALRQYFKDFQVGEALKYEDAGTLVEAFYNNEVSRKDVKAMVDHAAQEYGMLKDAAISQYKEDVLPTFEDLTQITDVELDQTVTEIREKLRDQDFVDEVVSKFDMFALRAQELGEALRKIEELSAKPDERMAA